MGMVFFGILALIVGLTLVRLFVRPGTGIFPQKSRLWLAALFGVLGLSLIAKPGLGSLLGLFFLMASIGSLALWRAGRAAPGPTQSDDTDNRRTASKVDTPYLAMTLNHETGAMDGTVLDGPLRGAKLSDLTEADIRTLYKHFAAAHADTAALLEAYAGWRGVPLGEGAGHHQAGGEAAAGTGLSVDEAYSMLGLTPGADAEAVQDAYRRLQKKLHPDVGGSEYLSQKLNEARAVLLDHLGVGDGL
ncbi:MAG: J domain-containing protein [Pseudomonadota bacterium]